MTDKEPIFQFNRSDESPGFLLWQVTNLWQRRIKAALSELGLTHVQFVLLASLAWLSREEGAAITQARLAAHAKTDIMMTSTVLRALEEKGLVRRTPHPSDTRAHAVRLSESAWPLVREAVRRVEQLDDAFFNRMGVDQAHFNAMLRALLSSG